MVKGITYDPLIDWLANNTVLRDLKNAGLIPEGDSRRVYQVSFANTETGHYARIRRKGKYFWEFEILYNIEFELEKIKILVN